MLSTGGTFRTLAGTGVSVTEVADYTEYPEMMDGRVKTLHPRVHGGLLGRLDDDGDGPDAAVMARHGIRSIDVVVVNLYPFEETVAKSGVSLADAIENIDIGGPAMLRSAAKNMARVSVIVDPADYVALAEELAANDGAVSEQFRQRLAKKAFAHVAHYDVAISDYLEEALDA
ncbi:MAG: hypothetical protein U5O39_08630 [Gammaproteobacteria bacterium]|nr:hypothetical protein [Gammaproteobacteria bacterium]